VQLKSAWHRLGVGDCLGVMCSLAAGQARQELLPYGPIVCCGVLTIGLLQEKKKQKKAQAAAGGAAADAGGEDGSSSEQESEGAPPPQADLD
jgi:hypothetical protein